MHVSHHEYVLLALCISMYRPNYGDHSGWLTCQRVGSPTRSFPKWVATILKNVVLQLPMHTLLTDRPRNGLPVDTDCSLLTISSSGCNSCRHQHHHSQWHHSQPVPGPTVLCHCSTARICDGKVPRVALGGHEKHGYCPNCCRRITVFWHKLGRYK